MSDLFKEIIPAIMHTKKDVPDLEKSYVPFIINRALSYHLDCVIFANQMNLHSELDKRTQFSYYINTIRSWKRPFQKWQKYEKTADLEIIKEYYNYSNERAREVMLLFSSEQINQLKEQLRKGGIDNGRPGNVSLGKVK